MYGPAGPVTDAYISRIGFPAEPYNYQEGTGLYSSISKYQTSFDGYSWDKYPFLVRNFAVGAYWTGGYSGALGSMQVFARDSNGTASQDAYCYYTITYVNSMNIVYAKEGIYQFAVSDIMESPINVEMICINKGMPNTTPVFTDNLLVSGIDNYSTLDVNPLYYHHVIRN